MLRGGERWLARKRGKPLEGRRVELVPSGVGNVNLPAQAFQYASFVDSNGGTDTNRHDALSVFRCGNGECHGLSPNTIHTEIRTVRRGGMMAQEHLAAANVCHHPKAAAGPRSAPR